MPRRKTPVDPLEEMAARRLHMDAKREQGKSRFVASVQYKGEIAAHILRGETSEEITAETARVAYYSMLGQYRHVAIPLTKQKHSATLWLRVANCCKLAQVAPGKYMHAIFDFYHRSFGKAPEIHQLTTDVAVSKVRRFYDLQGVSESCVQVHALAAPKTHPSASPTQPQVVPTPAAALQPKVTASSHYVPIPKSELFVLAESQMQRLMKANKLSRSQVYKELALPGDVYFPPTFLKQDPVYAQVLREQQ